MSPPCPFCGWPGMTGLDRLGASPAAPVRCGECGVLLATQPTGGARTLHAVAENLVVIAGIVAAAFLRSWWPLIGALLALLSSPVLLAWNAPLVAMTAPQVVRARRHRRWRNVGLVVVCGLLACWVVALLLT